MCVKQYVRIGVYAWELICSLKLFATIMYIVEKLSGVFTARYSTHIYQLNTFSKTCYQIKTNIFVIIVVYSLFKQQLSLVNIAEVLS